MTRKNIGLNALSCFRSAFGGTEPMAPQQGGEWSEREASTGDSVLAFFLLGQSGRQRQSLPGFECSSDTPAELQGLHDPEVPGATLGSPQDTIRTMLNAGNTCYVNSVLQALAPLRLDRYAFEALQPLIEQCSSHATDSRPLNPTGLFSLRTLMRR